MKTMRQLSLKKVNHVKLMKIVQPTTVLKTKSAAHPLVMETRTNRTSGDLSSGDLSSVYLTLMNVFSMNLTSMNLTSMNLIQTLEMAVGRKLSMMTSKLALVSGAVSPTEGSL